MRKYLSFIICLLFILLASCKGTDLEVQKCNTIYSMDTMINVTFYNTSNYKSHYSYIKNIYNEIADVASDYQSAFNNNGVKDLNENRELVINDSLKDLLEASLLMMEETNGYFNPFIGRLSKLWKEAINNNSVLDDEIISAELEIINATSLSFEGNKAILHGDGNIDLGAITKGYATQKVYEYLDNNNISNYLVSAGSSNVLLGSKNGNDFVVELEKPYVNDYGYIARLKGQNLAISTSSYKHQHNIIDEVVYHHIINPFTGKQSYYYDSVNVICDNSMKADVFSTAIYNMDLETAISFSIEKNIKIILYKDNKILYQSEGCGIYE